ncbi:hypothetical protein ACWGB8_28310 [Kitasatospora sp. NPDC054939]
MTDPTEADSRAPESDPTDPVLPDPIALPSADREAHRSTARWAADRFVSVLERVRPLVVFDRWGQPVGIPDYGSPAFAALAPTDPRREAALISAAEAWRQQAESAPKRIHADLRTHLAIGEQARAAWEAQDEAAWKDLVRTVRSWSNHPAAVELAAQRTRAAEQACRPVTPTAGWPRVAIPGRPGWRRHYRPDGPPVDRPDTTTATDLAESV